jgi:hypothetical protein
MITTMTPVREMPSSTRPTPPFTPPNTKSIASQGAPALQQRQGFDEHILEQLGQETDSLFQSLSSRPNTRRELFDSVNKLEEKVVVIIATFKGKLWPPDSLLENLGLKSAYESFKIKPGPIESYQELLKRIQNARELILATDTQK